MTRRDARLVGDLALSHLLSRDQIIALDYFGSVTRANTRLRQLIALGLVKRLPTPFYTQFLYSPGPGAKHVVSERIRAVLAHRAPSPQFVRHALSVTNARIALARAGTWRFEQQLTAEFGYAGQKLWVKPDGGFMDAERVLALEVDMGHISPSKIRQKLLAYDGFVRSGEFARRWRGQALEVLFITTGERRAASIRQQMLQGASFTLQSVSGSSLNIELIQAWS